MYSSAQGLSNDLQMRPPTVWSGASAMWPVEFGWLQLKSPTEPSKTIHTMENPTSLDNELSVSTMTRRT